MTTEAVVFDLGNVLIDWDPRHLYRSHFGEDEAAMEHFLSTVCTPAFNDELDRGRPFAEAIAELTERFPEHAELIARWDTEWDRMLGEPMTEAVDVLGELKSRSTPLYALSNWSAEKFELAGTRYDFLDWFDGIVISGEVGCTKPDPEIFRVLCDRFGLRPATTLFIDDLVANVEGAQRLGFDAIVFTDAASLRRELEARDLL